MRVLQAQCERRVGLLRYDLIAQGAAAVRERIAALRRDGVTLAVADAVDNDDLRVLADACADLPLLTAGSGLALGLPAVYAERGWLVPDADAAALDAAAGAGAVLAGSCSLATNAQVLRWQQAGRPALAIDPRALARGEPVAADALRWTQSQPPDQAVLIYATAPAADLQAVQAELGAQRAGALVEDCLAQIARGLVAQGVGIWIGFQAFINMGVNLGALPTKGLTLPLMSYGGSAIMMNLIAIAIVLRIDAENKQMMRGGRP